MATLATKRKALLTDYKQGNTIAPIDVLNLLLDRILLYIAHTCNIHMGTNTGEQSRNVELLRNLEVIRIEHKTQGDLKGEH